MRPVFAISSTGPCRGSCCGQRRTHTNEKVACAKVNMPINEDKSAKLSTVVEICIIEAEKSAKLGTKVETGINEEKSANLNTEVSIDEKSAKLRTEVRINKK